MGHSTDINENEHLQYIFNDYKSGIEHGILVANLVRCKIKLQKVVNTLDM